MTKLLLKVAGGEGQPLLLDENKTLWCWSFLRRVNLPSLNSAGFPSLTFPKGICLFIRLFIFKATPPHYNAFLEKP